MRFAFLIALHYLLNRIKNTIKLSVWMKSVFIIIQLLISE
jgi:hypothetical protein